MSFIQDSPEITDPYQTDRYLQTAIKWLLNNDQHQAEIKTDLQRFSNRLINEVHNWSLQAEAQIPELIQYSPWGERIDHIKMCDAWSKLDRLSAQEGLIHLGYDEANSTSGRIHQFFKLYLFHPSSAFYTCPLAMTDGGAKLANTLLKNEKDPTARNKLSEAFARLSSNDPDNFWTCGQWMTETTGGSDVGNTETIAKKQGCCYQLFGNKWFTSATTSQVAFTLARIEDETGHSTAGSRGLSLFYLELRDSNGKLNNMQVRRLKDKLGTKALPTAEIDLQGTQAYLIGEKGQGVKNIACLFNITRIYNACTTIGSFRRLLQLAEDYSDKRLVFGKKLLAQPLHQRLLSQANQAFKKCFILTFYTVKLLQLEEMHARNNSSEHRHYARLLRLFTPLAKLYSAKINMQWTSELIESFGGAAYIEDTGLPKFLRDAQVFCIWEGTTNVLSLDCLRAINKEAALTAYLGEMNQHIDKLPTSRKDESHKRLQKLNITMASWGEDQQQWQYHARELAFELCEIAIDILTDQFDACDNEKTP
ncbi:MAG TPA: acyl-CoA dehydrogenase [Oceanospirillales bacterium]|nr:acyl-CoA dehydrogenase [Oceanospirillales bacterium]